MLLQARRFRADAVDIEKVLSAAVESGASQLVGEPGGSVCDLVGRGFI